MESFPLLHNLQNETSFKGLHGHQGDGGGYVASIDADHVGVLVVTEVTHLLGLLVPGVPDDGVGEVVFLNPHFPTRHHVCDNVLVRRVDVNPVCPFIECDDLPTLLVCRRLGRSRTRRTLGPLPGSVEERDTIQPCNLTSANIRTLEVRVEHHVEVERAVLAGVVHADVQVQLLLPQDDPVGDLEVMLPHAVGEVTIAKGKYCLNITTGHPFGALFQLPFANSCKPMVGWTIHPIVPLTKLWKYKRNSTTNGLSAIKN